MPEGRAAHQGPAVAGTTRLTTTGHAVGDLVRAVVIDSDGVDLIAEVAQ